MASFKLKRLLCNAIILIVFLFLFYYRKQLFLTEIKEEVTAIEIHDVETLDLDVFPSFGVDAVEEYTPQKYPPKIPLIIHQTWKDRAAPSKVVKWMTSWSIYHPTWRYVYWTDETARCLIKDKHPNLLHIYDAYPENIRRADAVRYIIIYEIGGVYADIDLESLQSLDAIIRKYACILAQEPYEHPIMDGNFKHLVINAFLACVQKHPFMKLVMDRLADFNHFWNVLDSTGPHFLTFAYNTYRTQQNMNKTDKYGVYLAPAEYFFPTMDPAKFAYMIQLCKQFHNLNALKQQACVSLKTLGLQRKPYIFSFTIHHWIHTYFSNGFTVAETRDIFEVIPDANMYDCIKGINI